MYTPSFDLSQGVGPLAWLQLIHHWSWSTKMPVAINTAMEKQFFLNKRPLY